MTQDVILVVDEILIILDWFHRFSYVVLRIYFFEEIFLLFCLGEV